MSAVSLGSSNLCEHLNTVVTCNKRLSATSLISSALSFLTIVRMTPQDLDISTFISLLPKCELHMHLEGGLEPSLVRTFATRNNLPVPASSIDPNRISGYDFHDLTTFLAVYYPNMAVLQTAEDFYELAWTYLCKCKEQNVLHTEMFFDPQAHTSRGVSFGTVIGGYRRAIVRAERELGVSGSLIMCFLRDWQSEFAMATLMEALPYKDWIVGVGLDSDERGHPPNKFKTVFARAKQEGFLVTAHADIDQVSHEDALSMKRRWWRTTFPSISLLIRVKILTQNQVNSIEHIRQLVHEIKVDRIDHGTNIVESKELMEEVRRRGLGLTCVSRNAVCLQEWSLRIIVPYFEQCSYKRLQRS